MGGLGCVVWVGGLLMGCGLVALRGDGGGWMVGCCGGVEMRMVGGLYDDIGVELDRSR